MEEAIAKMRGRVFSEETKSKMSAAAIKRNRDKEGRFICQQ